MIKKYDHGPAFPPVKKQWVLHLSSKDIEFFSYILVLFLFFFFFLLLLLLMGRISCRPSMT